MTRPNGIPMPAEIRHMVRAPHHPARAVPCPHCGAHPHQGCTTPSKRRRLVAPHPQRVSTWVRETACCPACQVAPGTPCHIDGRPLRGGDVHPQRTTEAKGMAA